MSFPKFGYLTFVQFDLLIFNWNLDKFPDIFVNIEGEKMVDHIFEIPRPIVFGVKCFNCDDTK